jgi:hypothetical protein
MMVTASGQPEADAFPAIREAASESSAIDAAGLHVSVRYPPSAALAARETLDLLREVCLYLEEAVGARADGSATIYLAVVPPEHELPHAAPRGREVFTDVYFVRPVPLLDVPWNRDRYHGFAAHELAHHFLRDLPPVDRWFEDGLPEYLAFEFARSRSEEAYLAMRSTPPLVALHRIPLKPWNHDDFERFQAELRRAPELAFVIASEGVQRYAAAGGLVERWMAAASANGIEAPVRETVARLRALDRPATLTDLDEIARAQTGRSLEALAHVTAQERRAAAERAAKYLNATDAGVQTYAFRTLEAFGLPSTVTPLELVTALEGRTDQPVSQTLYLAAGAAVASAGDPAAARRLIELLRERSEPGAARRLIAPQLWTTLADDAPNEALAELVATVNDSALSLLLRRDANEALERLTGESVGWKIEQPAKERAKAAARWRSRAATAGSDQAGRSPRPTRQTTEPGTSPTSCSPPVPSFPPRHPGRQRVLGTKTPQSLFCGPADPPSHDVFAAQPSSR